MSDRAQCVAIAKALGNTCDNCGGTDCLCADVGIGSGVPAYTSDLNAMYDAEKVLLDRGDDWGVYTDTLLDLIVQHCGGYQAAELFCRASAKLRAEAFLRTMGLWVES